MECPRREAGRCHRGSTRVGRPVGGLSRDPILRCEHERFWCCDPRWALLDDLQEVVEGVLGLDRELLGSIVEAALQPDARAQSLLERFGADAMAQAQATLETTMDMTTMDIEIVGAVAPGCRIDVYTAPNTAGGFYAAIHAALGSDSSGSGSSEVSLPDAIAISWGRCESSWTANHLRPVDRALDVARSLGVPVCCASGDTGSCGSSGNARCAGVVFPASSPAALACGGTERSTEATSNGTRNGGSDREELVWNSAYLGVRGASGGGVSGFFARPDYQASVQPVASQPVKDGAWMSGSAQATADFVGRAVPDVAVHADPCSGYAFYAGGRAAIGGGTSAAAPFCAAVLACLGQELGVAVGWPNRLMYGEALAAAFQPVIRGDNDVTEGRLLYFKAGAPWNACTGLGSPLLDQLLAALRGEPAAKP